MGDRIIMWVFHPVQGIIVVDGSEGFFESDGKFVRIESGMDDASFGINK